MSLWNLACTYALYPALDPTRRGVGRKMRWLRRLEAATLPDNQQRQWAAVQRLAEHARTTSPFYRERFRAAGMETGALGQPADFARLPPLTRTDLRDHLPAICSSRYRFEDLLPSASGGTTDTPVAMRLDPAAWRQKSAVQLAFWQWAGIRAGDKVFWLWGAASDFSASPGWRWRLYDRHIMRRAWGATSRLTPEVLESYRERINRFRPAALCAYPTPLQYFCEYLRDSGRPIHGPRAVICTAEALLPHQRALARQVLGCEVFEHYATRDFGTIAAECEAHQGLHVQLAAAYLECLPLAADGTLRELVVTDLLNLGMPLLRYRINDCVLGGLDWEACPCGRGLPRLPGIAGRTTDTFRLPDGSLVPGVALTNRVIQVVANLVKTQVIQETSRDFRLRYVAGPLFRPADLQPLRQKLDEFLGPGLAWEFEAVSEIPREASGKTRFCICRLPEPPAAGGVDGR